MLSQRKLVEQHLVRFGHITTWEAIDLYGATRLSAIIYTLKYKYGYKDKIVSVRKYSRKWWAFWKTTHYVSYELKKEGKDGK